MKAKTLKLGILLFSFLFILSCSSGDDTPETDQTNQPDPDVIDNPDQGIDAFIWGGMNAAYLYKANVSNLANDKFATDQELFEFLSDFSSPEETFQGLRSNRKITAGGRLVDEDQFSFIVDDYVALEQSFSGVSKSNGMDYSFAQYPDGSRNIYGFIRYVLPGTDAEAKGLKRGDVFNTVNGVQITFDNYRSVFSGETHTIGLAVLTNASVNSNGESVSLTEVEYTENPILVAKTIDYSGIKIGYIMYNSFVGDFDVQLNDAFGQLKAEGATELILDLRYNGGGLVRTAIDMASMITGQFNGEIFLKELWNADLQAQFSSGAEGEEALINRFRNKIHTGAPINSLNLPKLHVLTSGNTASASELIINGLKPYIEVIQIGTTTVGKYQASVTLYDSEGFGRTGANPDHTYAIQPLVFKSANANDVTDYAGGLFPDVDFSESPTDMGVLGEESDPFLKTALDYIAGIATATTGTRNKSAATEIINWDRKSALPTYQRMYKGNSEIVKLKLNQRLLDQ